MFIMYPHLCNTKGKNMHRLSLDRYKMHWEQWGAAEDGNQQWERTFHCMSFLISFEKKVFYLVHALPI